MGESVRQWDVKPFVEEAVLQVSNWGFSISDLNIQKKLQGKGIIFWLKSIYKRPREELTGFLGPIHIWQVGADVLVMLNGRGGKWAGWVTGQKTQLVSTSYVYP